MGPTINAAGLAPGELRWIGRRVTSSSLAVARRFIGRLTPAPPRAEDDAAQRGDVSVASPIRAARGMPTSLADLLQRCEAFERWHGQAVLAPQREDFSRELVMLGLQLGPEVVADERSEIGRQRAEQR